jgi:hypothetical protein
MKVAPSSSDSPTTKPLAMSEQAQSSALRAPRHFTRTFGFFCRNTMSDVLAIHSPASTVPMKIFEPSGESARPSSSPVMSFVPPSSTSKAPLSGSEPPSEKDVPASAPALVVK